MFRFSDYGEYARAGLYCLNTWSFCACFYDELLLFIEKQTNQRKLALAITLFLRQKLFKKLS